jgi:FtsP/CotA-like multicopper oxidase with cupredoxin domain
VCAIITATAIEAHAQDPATTQNPPAARIERGAPGSAGAPAQTAPAQTAPAQTAPAQTAPAQTAPAQTAPIAATAPASSSIGGEARLTLRIGYTDTTIRNPGTRQLDRVRLRSYINEGAPATNVPLIAPTIEVFPGETVRITLRNQLPPEPNCDGPDINVPHCFNTTNLHGHGLEVSPSGNSDNVLISIRPQVDFQYEYNIPADHPAGTYWYHPHRHGSTALQVGSGMAGALIVRGNRVPTLSAPGDIDTLLRNRDGSPYLERVMVFQQIAYACRDAAGAIKKNADGTWLCQPGDIGTIENYDVFGQNAWRASGRYTTINGRTVEPLAQRAVVGRPERWRLIHAGVRDTLRMSIRRRRPGAAAFTALRAQDQQAWIDANCEPQPLPTWEVASDGLTRTRAQPKDSVWIQPGYRSDLLVVFPSAGDYCVVDEEAPPDQSVNGGGTGRQLLTVVTAEGTAPPIVTSPNVAGDLFTYLRSELQASARQFMPVNVRQRVVDELSDLSLGSFMANHSDLRNVTPSGSQPLVFKFPPSVGVDSLQAKPYDPNRIDRQLTLGAVEDWLLASHQGGHPFHIHINPYQVVRVLRISDQRDLTLDPQSEYFGLAGVWKDTLFVQPGVIITARTRYQRYIGDFVLHCHILDHEDTGMMQNVRIGLPNGRGGQEPATHGTMSH